MRAVMGSLGLLALVAGTTLTSCRRHNSTQSDSEWWRLEGDRIAISSNIELQRLRLAKRLKKVSRAEKAFAEYEAITNRREELEDRVSSLRTGLSRCADEMNHFVSQSRSNRRAATKGLKLESLTSTGGWTYRNVEIKSVTDAGLVISHSSGIARLVAADLSNEQQANFGVDAELSREAVEREHTVAAAYHRRVDRHLATLDDNVRAGQRNMTEFQGKFPKPTFVSSVATRSENPLHQPARPVGSGYRKYRTSRTYPTYPTYRTYLSHCRPGSYVSGFPLRSSSFSVGVGGNQSSRYYFSSTGNSRSVGGASAAPSRSSATPTPSILRPCPTD